MLAATTEALQLVSAEPATPLYAQVLSVHARANADRNRDDDAARWAGEALRLGRTLGLAGIVADATTTLARLDERAGDPASSRRALERIITDARATGDVTSELRALHNLGGLHFEQGQLSDAQTIYRLGTDLARSIGRPWAPYGLDSRVRAGLVAYQSGDWATADHIVDVSGQAPPGMAEAALAAVSMCVAAGRGDERGLDLLAHIRPWWGRDGMIAILSGGAAIDLHGDRGRLGEAQAAYDDIVASVGELWQLRDFQARIRLSALVLVQLAAAAPRSSTAEGADLARRGDELAQAASRSAALSGGQVRRRGPEGDAWLARVHAEHLRLRWLTGVDAPPEDELVTSWQHCVAAFERYPHVFESARSQSRLAAVLRAAGRTAEARPLATPRGRPPGGWAHCPCSPSCARSARRDPFAETGHRDSIRPSRHESRRSLRWWHRGEATARSAATSTSAPRPSACTSPTSWPSSVPADGPRRSPSPGGGAY